MIDAQTLGELDAEERKESIGGEGLVASA